MAHTYGEDPSRSVTTFLEDVDYPTSRAELVADAEDAGAPADVINLLKSMPRPQYGTFQEAQRDLGEASRRFAMGNQAAPEEGVNRDRRNLGRDAIENAPPGHTRHP